MVTGGWCRYRGQGDGVGTGDMSPFCFLESVIP